MSEPVQMEILSVAQPGGPEQIRPGTGERPRAGHGEVLIRTRAIGVNRADCLQRRGLYPPPEGASPLLGLEVAGEVAELGAGVTRFQPGDRVCALLTGGGYAQYVVAEEACVVGLPAGIDFIAGAGIAEVFATAWHALFVLARVQAGETILVHAGASGVGTATVQLARWRGARALVTAGSAEKVARCVELGAAAGCNYHEQDFVETVWKHTGGRGVDMILDVVGARYFERNVDALAMDGRLVILGLQGGHTIEKVRIARWLQKRLSIHAHTLRNHTARKREVMAQLAAEVLPAMARGELRPVIDRVFPWREAAAAHRWMEANRNIGKIILEVPADRAG